MVVKNELSPLERLRKLLKEQHSIIQTSDLSGLEIPRTYLSILERNGEIERISRGIYREPNSIEDEMFSFQARYKASIFSHETALYLHDLTDRTPLFYSVTVPSGYHSISLKNSGSKIYYLNRALFALGVKFMNSPQGNEIRATGLERTICDILRSRNQVDIQLVNDSLKRYARSQEKNIDLLYRYARQFGIHNIAREYLEILL
jgi:predicted transcriptional regulator of viral defense system